MIEYRHAFDSWPWSRQLTLRVCEARVFLAKRLSSEKSHLGQLLRDKIWRTNNVVYNYMRYGTIVRGKGGEILIL